MAFQEIRSRSFANGTVYALKTADGFPLEVTDTFLPFYTRDAIGRKQNLLDSSVLGDRTERWMCGVSVASGCPVRCQFCCTGQLKRFRNLTAEEIVEQVEFVLGKNNDRFTEAKEHKINYTRMGDTFLNVDNVRKAIEIIDRRYPGTHHYVSTIGIRGSDFSWIRDNITLQLSLHSLDEDRRNKLIPFKRKMSIEELGQVRTESKLKTTLNMTLVDERDFDIDVLRRYFDLKHFFIKLSPINENETSVANKMGKGIVNGLNLV